MSDSPRYIHLAPGAALPSLATSPFRAVVVIDSPVTPDWQALVSEWLVQAGCLYMMAWGLGCSSWDDSVDFANLEEFSFGDIPDDRFVMTTWHSNAPLKDVFWFSKHTAAHPTIKLDGAILIHIADSPTADELLQAYDEA